MERSALGGSERKLSLPVLQNGTNAVVFMFPAIRSGRSAKNTVTGLTPCSASLLIDLSKVIRCAVCTKRKSACLAPSLAGCARADSSEAADAMSAAATNLRLVSIGSLLLDQLVQELLRVRVVLALRDEPLVEQRLELLQLLDRGRLAASHWCGRG